MTTLGVEEAAKLLRISPRTLAARAKARVIPGAKIGREWVFLEVDLLAFLRQQYTKEPATCPSTSKKAVRSGGSVSRIQTTPGYVGQLEQLIARKRSASTTRSRQNSGA